ncbi:uncharacterized protein Z518_07639 [Rhinocladiella mackenziei CBS 650.93]|uniref:Rhinocladiella mackenziei CBS 650.93 unplaced genomic scaffold supercont1.5, whole genome shotgun sequence n=1 Tax=Rhinocladiella mackenziei CBS 650.93 TaxID=1442369 RepID=A0A0D2ILM1_9EURO|nr:uncharacterized protein Z518_07639 [Rhinocladiella mackenziei CBS 650.93]KIX04086.1 hypothetical protein Z518_07639 [Rhinocladiella mackenziei CBS 650.93]
MNIHGDIGTAPSNLSLLASRPERCIATDQAGKNQVIVTAATTPPGEKLGKGKGLRFVIMRAPNLEKRHSSHSRRLKKRQAKSCAPPKRDPFPPLSPQRALGHPRRDEFNALPIENTRSVDIALDYVVVHLLHDPFSSHTNELPNVYLPVLRLGMEHEDLFEAIVAFSLVHRETNYSYARIKVTPDIAYHNGRAIEALRKKLTNPKTCADDAAILTSLLLTDGAAKYGTRAELLVHYTGLKRMVSMRGGAEALGKDGTLRAVLEYAERVADLTGVSRETEAVRTSDDKRCSQEPDLPISRLQYPAHPFPPDLCTGLADLSEGFRELALSCRLSTEVIRLVIAAHKQICVDTEDRYPRTRIYCPTMVVLYAKRYLEVSDRVTESIVCLSIIMISMRSFASYFRAQDRLLLENLVLLASKRGIEESTLDQYHHFVWTIIMAAEGSRSDVLSPYVDTLICTLLGPSARNELKAQDFLQDWTKLEKILKKYLWRSDLLYEWKCTWESAMASLKMESERNKKSSRSWGDRSGVSD